MVFRISNKFFYIFLAVAGILVLSFGVFALSPGVKPNPGHLFDEVAPPSGCASNQFLKWTGSSWTCGACSAGSGCSTTTKTCSATYNGIFGVSGKPYPSYTGLGCNFVSSSERDSVCASSCAYAAGIACSGDTLTQCTGGTYANYNTGVSIGCDTSVPSAFQCTCSTTQTYKEEAFS